MARRKRPSEAHEPVESQDSPAVHADEVAQEAQPEVIAVDVAPVVHHEAPQAHEPAPATAYLVKSHGAPFWRAGRLFNPVGVVVDARDLSEAELGTLQREPRLSIEVINR